MRIATVAIIGRPNVGKSTLFNALKGCNKALTAKEAGTTRDRIFCKIETDQIDYFLVDTGGMTFGKRSDPIENDMQQQSQIALEEADIIILLISHKEGLLRSDYEITELLRKKGQKKPIILAVNKCDHALLQGELADYYQLGLNEPLMLSATHKIGLDKLEQSIIKQCQALHFISKNDPRYQELHQIDDNIPQIAIVGRPNVGKSSLLNAWLGKVRVITSPVPGTTRDAIDTPIQIQKKQFNLIDTAGIRKSGQIKSGIEKFSYFRTVAAINRCDIAALVIDSSEAISHQDQHIANIILNAYKGLILIINKWDIKKDPEQKEEARQKQFLRGLKNKFAFLPWAPVVFTSAMTKKNLTQIFMIFSQIYRERKQRIKTSELNHFLNEIKGIQLPPRIQNSNPQVLYLTQVDVNPPHFIFFVNKKNAIHFSYKRFLENRLREHFGFNGTALHIALKEKNDRKMASL